ncbi:Xyloglucan endotransglucosylase/hydrolase [Psidium guajava]|nr:Xyloglucan endotransglucosylase/hydrolase [Psidium guajava]
MNEDTYVVGGDVAGGIAGDELELNVYAAKEVVVLGLKPRAGVLVEREGEKLATLGYLGSLVRSTSRWKSPAWAPAIVRELRTGPITARTTFIFERSLQEEGREEARNGGAFVEGWI